ncbi:MAG: hypothetical protein VX169_03645 [Pseudomonadota bacterium]|nr:hypothetical protein [Pseudomonadota bacterium]
MNETRLKIHKKLLAFGRKISDTHLSEFHNPKILDKKIIKTQLVNYDFSKQKINNEAFEYLLQIPDLIELRHSLRKLLDGEIQNPSENKKVTHTLYRDKNPKDKCELISNEREKIKLFLKKNSENQVYKNLICLGIGGSRLGPQLLNEFLALSGPIKVYFCSSYDLLELKGILKNCKQSETILFASSKSFETSEILKNLEHAKSWFKKDQNINFQEHFFGISSNQTAMFANGIKESNQFRLLDSLGGRFSLWSSISLPALVNSDYQSYLELLEGANLADELTLNSQWKNNIAVIMALFSIWNTNSLNINNHGIFTYNFRLRSLTNYLAQLSMESNGKSLNFRSEISPFLTSPLIWGGYGIECQHSTFQWMMQGKTHTACDFIGVNDQDNESMESQKILLSQVLAMSFGKEDVENPYKSVKGNNPCSILQLNQLNLKSLGFLLALYEHKIFVEALILGVDPFDQWGVQLGKNLLLSSNKDNKFLKNYFSSDIVPKA